jgi:hypothetical protein
MHTEALPQQHSLALSFRGEIEIFASRAGHVTDYHYDYMDNFTIQV